MFKLILFLLHTDDLLIPFLATSFTLSLKIFALWILNFYFLCCRQLIPRIVYLVFKNECSIFIRSISNAPFCDFFIFYFLFLYFRWFSPLVSKSFVPWGKISLNQGLKTKISGKKSMRRIALCKVSSRLKEYFGTVMA